MLRGEERQAWHVTGGATALDREDTAANGCQVDEIIDAGNDTPFNALAAAHAAGYDTCAKCLGASNQRRAGNGWTI